jgi:hypothetical protein
VAQSAAAWLPFASDRPTPEEMLERVTDRDLFIAFVEDRMGLESLPRESLQTGYGTFLLVPVVMALWCILERRKANQGQQIPRPLQTRQKRRSIALISPGGKQISKAGESAPGHFHGGLTIRHSSR